MATTKTLANTWALAVDGGIKLATFANADGTTLKSIYTANTSNGSIVLNGHIWSNETAANTVTFYLQPSGSTSTYQLFTRLMAATSADGYTDMAISAVTAPGALSDNAGNRYYQLAAGDQILAGVKTAVSTTTGKILVVTLNYKDFA